jgi:hypothetical protein
MWIQLLVSLTDTHTRARAHTHTHTHTQMRIQVYMHRGFDSFCERITFMTVPFSQWGVSKEGYQKS